MIRDPLPSDQAFVASTWARSVLSTGRAHHQVPHATRRHGQNRSLGAPLGRTINNQIDAVFDRRGTRVLITAWDEFPDVILGWMAFEAPSTVHYVWVRQQKRGHGIASAMLRTVGISPESGAVCTSHGPDSDEMRRIYKARYVPLEEFLK